MGRSSKIVNLLIFFSGNIINFVVATAMAWTSSILPKLEDSNTTPFDRPLSIEETSWVSAILTLGGVFGPFIFGYLADKIGRKYSLLLCGFPILACYFVLAFAKVIVLYYITRFIIGLAAGGAFTVIPMYVGEIAEDSNRGALGSAMNVFICGGLLFSYIVGPYTSIMAFNLILAIFPAAFLVLFYFLAPESPHFYVSNRKHDLAKLALQKLRGSRSKDIEEELTAIQIKTKDENSGTLLDIFKSRGLIKAFIISVGLLAFQQLSGINAVLFYSQSIFTQAGSSLDPAVCAIIVGVVQFVASFFTPLVVERLGRKILLLFSAVGMVVAEVPLGVYSYLQDQNKDVSSISFLPLLCLIVYIITFHSGSGPLPWAIRGELFPTSVKSAGSSLSAAICWFIGFLIAKYFQPVSDAIGMGPSFWIFAGFCILSVPFYLLYVIETKGKSLQEIQDALNN